MAFDYSKLRGRIVEKYGSQNNFARAMDWTPQTMTRKMGGIVQWKQSDICKALDLLDLTYDDVQDYFFTLKVQSI